MTKKPVIIVGGGIGGMTTALALAKRNIPSILLEQAPQFREMGAGIQFCPNTSKMIDYLGITPAFDEIAIYPDFLCYRDGITNFEIMRLNLKGEFLKRFKYPFGSYRREDVLRVFVAECRKSPLVTLITSARVIHVEDLGSHVIAKTETGQVYEGDALIGCDGIWSIAREHILSSKEKPRISGQIIYRGVVAHKDMPSYLELGSIVHWVRPGCHLVHYPIGNKGMYNISAIFQTDRKPDPSETQGDKNELFTYFEGSRPEVMDLLERVDASRMWSLCDRNPISNWSKGRMTILGDAAHATLPYLTSGAGMAVEDAVVLAKKIEESGFRYEEAFKAYQKERYLRAAYVQYFSRAYGDVHHSSGVARELRNTLISERSEDENLDWVNYLYSGIEV